MVLNISSSRRPTAIAQPGSRFSASGVGQRLPPIPFRLVLPDEATASSPGLKHRRHPAARQVMKAALGMVLTFVFHHVY
jgi:hypothetical protein